MPVKRAPASSAGAPKRTRFASPSANAGSSSRGRSRSPLPPGGEEEDDLLQADLPQGAQAARQRERRQLRGAEGYDSDSSNDDEGVAYSRRKDKQAEAEAEDEGDVDMFGGDASEDEADKKGKGKGKAEEANGKGKGKGKGKGADKEFMELGDIEGQEFAREGSLASSADAGMGDGDGDGDGDGEDEDARVARRKQGLDGDMGFQLTGFNMKEEMEEGKFTADGETYVANAKDEGEKHDQWLTDLDEEAVRKARAAHRERERREQELEEAENSAGRKEEEERLMRRAVELMERGETVLEALQRLGKEVEEKRRKDEVGGGGKKKSWAERQKERKAAMAAKGQDGMDHDGPAATPSDPFTALTEIVSKLGSSGQLDVYALSRESIQRMLPAQPAPAPSNGQDASSFAASPAPPRDTRAFQYRFSMAYVRTLPENQRPVEREVFGPFPSAQLSQWRNTGFFGGPACENVELRLAGATPGPWGSWNEVVG